jgi:hypothetical protein
MSDLSCESARAAKNVRSIFAYARPPQDRTARRVLPGAQDDLDLLPEYVDHAVPIHRLGGKTFAAVELEREELILDAEEEGSSQDAQSSERQELLVD